MKYLHFHIGNKLVRLHTVNPKNFNSEVLMPKQAPISEHRKITTRHYNLYQTLKAKCNSLHFI